MLDYARDAPRFVRFVNMLINDSIYAVDEALSKLKEIRDVQTEMADEAAWARLLQMGRRFPQLHVKLSALFRVTGLGAGQTADPGFADLRPRLAALLEVFGADRLMWGSDFPYVVLEAGGYEGSKAALEAMLEHLGASEADAAMVLGGTAQKLFFSR